MDLLRAKCTSSVNLIKHVSHLSWRADRKTLQRLYTTLMQSKLEYGASKSNVLNRLEPIQNACLRAITGAFRSSPAVSLCVETGMLPLDFFPCHANTQALLQNSKPAKLPYPPCSDRPTGRPNSKNGAHQRTTYTIPGTNPQDINKRCARNPLMDLSTY